MYTNYFLTQTLWLCIVNHWQQIKTLNISLTNPVGCNVCLHKLQIIETNFTYILQLRVPRAYILRHRAGTWWDNWESRQHWENVLVPQNSNFKGVGSHQYSQVSKFRFQFPWSPRRPGTIYNWSRTAHPFPSPLQWPYDFQMYSVIVFSIHVAQ